MIAAEVTMDLSEEAEGIYTAGVVAPPGRYCRIDRPEGPTLILERPGFLPGSLDGHVAVYQRLPARLTLQAAGVGAYPPRAVAAID